MTGDPLHECLADVLQPGGASRPVVALPDAARPRAYLADATGRAAARALHDQYGGGGVRRRLEVAIMSALVACGVAARMRRWRANSFDPPVESMFRPWLEEKLGRSHRVGLVLLGPPRANRKPVVLVTDQRGRLLAVAKLGCTEVTRPLVRHETAALDTVAAVLGTYAHVPALIAADRLGDTQVVLMRPLPRLRSAVPVPRHALIDIVRTVSLAAPGRRADLRDSLAHVRMRPLAAVAEAVAVRTAEVPFGSIHGDLHVGNLGVAADGKPALWDWERWAHGIPLGFDLLHYDLQTWITAERAGPAESARRLISRAADILAPLGIPASVAPDVTRDYLIRLAARYTGDAQDLAGSRLGAVEEWLFPALLERQADKEHS